MTEREVESRCAECGSNNRIPMLPRDPATDVPGVLCLECSDFVPQPERVECLTNCKHGKWGHKFLPDGSGRTGWLTRQEIFRPYKSKFCPDCGQSLKGAGE